MTRSLTELKSKTKKYRVLGLIALFIGGFSLFIGSTLNHKECIGACSTQDWFNAGGNPNAVWFTVQDGGLAVAFGWILIALGIWATTLAVHFNSLIKSSSSIIEGLGGKVGTDTTAQNDKEASFCQQCGSRRARAFCGTCGAAFKS